MGPWARVIPVKKVPIQAGGDTSREVNRRAAKNE